MSGTIEVTVKVKDANGQDAEVTRTEKIQLGRDIGESILKVAIIAAYAAVREVLKGSRW